MSILIKGMEMPKSCEDCPLEKCDENYYGDESNHRCPLMYKGYTSDNRHEKCRDDCPLVPVPEHGRLGDLDKLADNMRSATAGMEHRAYIMHEIRRAPTIIPADKEGE